MSEFQTVLSAVLPVFGIVGVGLLIRKLNWLTEEADHSLLRVNINLLLPCLILDSTLGNAALSQWRNLLLAPAVGFATVAVGMALHKPLVYSRGTDEPPVADLVGAYDIGHTGALLASVLGDGRKLTRLAENARRVGVDARVAVVIIDLGISHVDGLAVHPLVRLEDAVADLSTAGDLPSGQAAAVRDWIVAQRT